MKPRRPSLAAVIAFALLMVGSSAQAQFVWETQTAPPFNTWAVLQRSAPWSYGAGGFLVFQAKNKAGNTIDPAYFNGGILDGDPGHENGDIDMGVMSDGKGYVMALRGDCLEDGVGVSGGLPPANLAWVPCLVTDSPKWQIGAKGAAIGKGFFGYGSFGRVEVNAATEALQASGDARALNVTHTSQMDEQPAVAGYFTTNKLSTGAGFGAVAEVEDVLGFGPVWGLEVDALSVGDASAWLRRGIGIVLGVNQGRQIPTTIGYGLDILPFWRDRDYVTVNYGIHVGVPAKVAAIAVRAGEKIALEESGQVAIRFNPATASVELLWGDRVLQSWR